MTGRARTAVARLLVVCAAWALGEALLWQLRAVGIALIVPALLAAAAYVATGGTGWRGRRIDRDRWH